MAAGTSARGRPPRARQYDLDSLLAVAVSVFNERGYDGTSMEDLATAAGITKSSIYHHVSGKEQLLRLAVERALEGLFAVTREEGAKTGPAIARLEYVLRREVEVLTERLPYVTLLLRVRGNTDTERWALQQRRTFDRFVQSLVRKAAEEGDLHPGVDPALAERLVFGMINSIVEWYRPGRVPVPALADAVVRLAMSGLRAAPRRRGTAEHPGVAG